MLNMEDLIELRAKLLSKLNKPAFMFIKSANAPIILSTAMRTRAGTANYTRHSIKLNKRLLDANPHHIEQTFAHELAHLVAFELYGSQAIGHGVLWARVMNMFGYQPRRCHSLDVTGLQSKHKSFAVYCNCDTHMIKSGRWNKMRRGVNYICKACDSRLRFTK